MEQKGKKKREPIQILFVGPSFVGKTALINRIANNYFVKIYHPTSSVIKYHIEVNIGEDEHKEDEKIPVVLVFA